MRKVLALLAVLALSGCGILTEDQPVGQAPPERGTLRVGVGDAIDTAPLRIAVAAGEFSRAGLRVELVEQQSQEDGLARLGAGELDIVFATDVALFRAAAGGTELQLQGEAYTAGRDTMALVTLPESDYQDVTAKKAPRIAVDLPDDLGALAGRSVLATAGVDPAGVEFVTTPAADMVEAVRSGAADAAWMVEPGITTARKEFGARILSDGARGATLDFPVSSYASSTEFAKGNPRALAIFRDALGRAQARADDPAVVRQALPALADIDATTAALIALGTYPSSLNGIRLQRVADLMHASGSIPGRLDVQSLLPQVTPD
ncbi:sulfonate ABC transporter substrate-binding protein [Amycolatopsis antarctica]|uniref:Sulfonate ABC transporter substrate-binding protein n=1 Tax=Amycolatopsis antarctica TaxID=1854586 RepID=A0A263CX48_9PSEU|nr:ABC transporter substrate-binding protein [Amycolatopsis antarctica]OZM70528.1 sulfonate ABC transporter substrate-binding protein [Amycolatopsis antarctica]